MPDVGPEDGATFTYDGEVRLLCQEGGFADASIELVGLPSDAPALGVTQAFREAVGEEFGQGLAFALRALFAPDEDPTNGFGDVDLGRLRITVERIAEP